MVAAGGHCFQYKVLFTINRLSFNYQTQRGEIAIGRKEDMFFCSYNIFLLFRSAPLVGWLCAVF